MCGICAWGDVGYVPGVMRDMCLADGWCVPVVVTVKIKVEAPTTSSGNMNHLKWCC